MYYLSDIEITASNTHEECVYEGDSLLRRNGRVISGVAPKEEYARIISAEVRLEKE